MTDHPKCLFDDVTTGFDVGAFDVGSLHVTSTDSLPFSEINSLKILRTVLDTLPFSESRSTKYSLVKTDTLPLNDLSLKRLITSTVDSLPFSDGATLKITATPTDDLLFLESVITNNSILISESLTLKDESPSGFDNGVFDTLHFDQAGVPAIWTKLSTPQPDSFSFLESVYTEGIVQYGEVLRLSEGISFLITTDILDTINCGEVYTTKVVPPVVQENLTLSDLSATKLIKILSDSLSLSDALRTLLIATIKDPLNLTESKTTKITTTSGDTILFTEIVTDMVVIRIYSHMTDSLDIDSAMVDTIILQSKILE